MTLNNLIELVKEKIPLTEDSSEKRKLQLVLLGYEEYILENPNVVNMSITKKYIRVHLSAFEFAGRLILFSNQLRSNKSQCPQCKEWCKKDQLMFIDKNLICLPCYANDVLSLEEQAGL